MDDLKPVPVESEAITLTTVPQLLTYTSISMTVE